jgi:hypothetical protein
MGKNTFFQPKQAFSNETKKSEAKNRPPQYKPKKSRFEQVETAFLSLSEMP